MKDQLDTWSGILLGSLVVLMIVILVLGISVLVRMSRVGGRASFSGLVLVLLSFAFLVLAFFAVFLPPLSLVPALCFFALAVRALGRGPGFPRELGAVLLLAAVSWSLYTAYEIVMADWSRTVSGPIRVDILLVVPVMGVISYFGWLAASMEVPGRPLEPLPSPRAR